MLYANIYRYIKMKTQGKIYKIINEFSIFFLSKHLWSNSISCDNPFKMYTSARRSGCLELPPAGVYLEGGPCPRLRQHLCLQAESSDAPVSCGAGGDTSGTPLTAKPQPSSYSSCEMIISRTYTDLKGTRVCHEILRSWVFKTGLRHYTGGWVGF
jgi:hypothetical protein